MIVLINIINKLFKEIVNAKKSGKIRFYVFTMLGFLTAVMDLSITYIGSPDLKLEANPLIAIFGFGWPALIIANIIYMVLFTGLIYIAFIKYKRPVIECNDFKEYMSMLYFDSPDKYKWLWYKFPKGKGKMIMVFAPVGYAVAYTFPVIRLLAILGWVLFLSVPDFCFYCFFNLPHLSFAHMEVVFFSLVGILSLYALVYYWFRKEYKINKQVIDGMSQEQIAKIIVTQKAELKVKQIAELEAKLKAEFEASREAGIEERLTAELEAKQKLDLEAKQKAEVEEKQRLEREAVHRAELEAKYKAKFETEQQAKLEAMKKAEEQAKLKAELKAKQKIESEERQKIKDEEKHMAALDAKVKAEVKAKYKAELKAIKKAESEANKIAKIEAKQKAELEAYLNAKQELNSLGWSSVHDDNDSTSSNKP